MKPSNIFLFVRSALRDFAAIGEIAPSSYFTTSHVLKHGRIAESNNILEIGPGMGPFTKEILKAMPTLSRLTVVEKNPAFADFLKTTFVDNRLTVVEGDVLAKELPINERFDTVISSIPLSLLRDEQKNEFVEKIKLFLKPNGIFVNAQYSLSNKSGLEQNGFEKVKWSLELRNIPPIFIYSCQKQN